jgi:hypothetical protein
MLVTDENAPSQDETTILHPSSRMLFRFWETMRGDNAAPRRDDLDLRQIRQLVPYLFIGEYATKARMYRWRLAGTGVCELYRRELTGTNMLAGWDAFETDTISRFLSATIASKQPAVLRFRMQTDRNQVVGAEMAAFPMLAVDGVTTHLMGGLFPFRETWSLGYTALTGFELSAARLVWTENLPEAPPQEHPASKARRNFHVISGGLSTH